jgi:hypothetical protein
LDEEGPFTVEAKSFVEASGNANLVHLAGIEPAGVTKMEMFSNPLCRLGLIIYPSGQILKSELEEAIH